MISSDGAGRRAIGRVLNMRHGVTDQHMQISMSGKTDPQIMKEILLAANLPEEEIHLAIDELIDLYLECLQAEIENASYYIVHEGVYELVDTIKDRSQIYLGLLTGNVERGARMKLEQFGLNKHFPIGAYGSDSANRLELPALAKERAEKYYGIDLAPEDLVIIGDSVNDILCAHTYGAKCIAVNSGKTTWAELEALKPQYLIKSLVDTDAVIEAILAPVAANLDSQPTNRL